MKQIVPGEIHLVIAERQDKVTGVHATRHPQQFLANLATATDLGRVEVRPSRHADLVLDGMGKRLAAAEWPKVAGCFWTRRDFEDVIAALDEYDLDRGCLIARDGIKLHDPVFVTKMGRGKVTGFTRCGRLMVKLDRADGLAEVAALAPRSCVKPVLRPAA